MKKIILKKVLYFWQPSMGDNWPGSGGPPRKPEKLPHTEIREVENEYGSFGYYECKACGEKGFTIEELNEKSCK